MVNTEEESKKSEMFKISFTIWAYKILKSFSNTKIDVYQELKNYFDIMEMLKFEAFVRMRTMLIYLSNLMH